LKIENNLKHLQISIKKLLNEINDIKEQNGKENNGIKKINNKKYKNPYYLEEITKKVFVLLYYNEILIQTKLTKNIKDIYNFKRYYLINNEWLKEYKKFFLYDFVEKKIESEYKNKNYSFKWSYPILIIINLMNKFIEDFHKKLNNKVSGMLKSF